MARKQIREAKKITMVVMLLSMIFGSMGATYADGVIYETTEIGIMSENLDIIEVINEQLVPEDSEVKTLEIVEVNLEDTITGETIDEPIDEPIIETELEITPEGPETEEPTVIEPTIIEVDLEDTITGETIDESTIEIELEIVPEGPEKEDPIVIEPTIIEVDLEDTITGEIIDEPVIETELEIAPEGPETESPTVTDPVIIEVDLEDTITGETIEEPVIETELEIVPEGPETEFPTVTDPVIIEVDLEDTITCETIEEPVIEIELEIVHEGPETESPTVIEPTIIEVDLEDTITGETIEEPLIEIDLEIVPEEPEMEVPTVTDPAIIEVDISGNNHDDRGSSSSKEKAKSKETVQSVIEKVIPQGTVEFFSPYMSGYEDGSFRPSEPGTRAEIATIFARILNLDTENTGIKIYDDLAEEHWSYKFVQAATKAGLIEGYGDNQFKPDQPITRAELTSVFEKYWDYTGVEVDESDAEFKPDDITLREQIVVMVNKIILRPDVELDSPSFSDVTLDYWAFGAIESAVKSFKLNEYAEIVLDDGVSLES